MVWLPVFDIIHLIAHVQGLPHWLHGCGVCVETGRPEFDSCFQQGSFCRSSHTSDLKLVIQSPGAIGSVQGLVGPVSVYYSALTFL